MLQATTSTASTTTTTKFIKPSFVAPSQPLEKSLKDHIQRTAGIYFYFYFISCQNCNYNPEFTKVKPKSDIFDL